MSREDCWRSLLDVQLGTERKADVPGCAGRKPGGPCLRSHWVQREKLTSQGVRAGQLETPELAGKIAGGHIGYREENSRSRVCGEDSWKSYNGQEILLDVLAGCPIGNREDS